jgi:NAD(P)H-dependent flavin oxidoreductase YrpB (nitropropane dioxygenase family)
MLRTRATALFEIDHPVFLGGMAGATSPELVAAVSNAGGLGILGCANKPPEWVAKQAAEIRARTSKPWGMNLLLFAADEPLVAAVLAAKPPVFSTAWPTAQQAEQDLGALFTRAHAAGSKVLHMASRVADAKRGAAAGADAIVAQGTEGGGHVGLIGTMVLLPQVVRAVAPVPVLAAGGVATGEGLAAALALGGEGVLLGTRFLATPESPVPEGWKRAILASDGDDTLLTEIPDVARGRAWPGAYSRVTRNRYIERWLGREGDLRRRQKEIAAGVEKALAAGDVDEVPLFIGQDAGLIDAIEPAADVVARVVREAEAALARAAAAAL